MRSTTVLIAFAFLTLAASQELTKIDNLPADWPEWLKDLLDTYAKLVVVIGAAFLGSWYLTFQLFDFLLFEFWCKVFEKDIGFFDYTTC
jgi:mannose/fructose/N-acetylgalactosamine-specific phosphotransferase system component IIC